MFRSKTSSESIRFSYIQKPMRKDIAITLEDPAKWDMHPEHEILLILGNGVSYAIEDQKYDILPYTLLMIPPNTYHHLIPEPPYTGCYERYMLCFHSRAVDETLLQSVFQQPGCYRLSPNHPITQAFRNLDQFCQDIPSAHTDLVLKTACTQILLDIYRLQETASLEVSVSTANSYPVLAYIEENLTQIQSLDQIAQHFYMSTSALTHQFRTRMGITLMRYIRQKRLLLARSLLEKGGKPLDVAAKCGFREYTTFYKAYLQFFGFPPSKNI